MVQTVRPSKLKGAVHMPGSKSHTIRALTIATLAGEASKIAAPLQSADTEACVSACRALGAEIEYGESERGESQWLVQGTGGEIRTPEDVIDVANSGTTLNITLGMASLGKGWSVFTGDRQIRRRPAGPLLGALNDLGAAAVSTRDNGCPPLIVKGALKGGEARIACLNSQFLSSLLINCPMADGDTDIQVTELAERPYVEMTLDWLHRQGIRLQRRGLEEFHIPGGQRYTAFARRIPGDYSSATFFLCAAAVTGSTLTLLGLDPRDTQGDKEVLSVLTEMGCRADWAEDRLTFQGGELEGREIDLNRIPDSLPAMAVVGCLAKGKTSLINVPQARIKETDRIQVMARELAKMGARTEELPDGLIIHESRLHGADVDGHGDHRVVMALAVAALAAEGESRIVGAEAAAVTFPDFFEILQGICTH
jgi:3-phosphoshikimate 1-carboxyvinyltransferase